ncbi:unnamed protein product [Amoebophrya sp. A25]|nr:unnamed protein product [Amoebophrya sp. A25]|eukprot:GSA25T00026859001.1
MSGIIGWMFGDSDEDQKRASESQAGGSKTKKSGKRSSGGSGSTTATTSANGGKRSPQAKRASASSPTNRKSATGGNVCGGPRKSTSSLSNKAELLSFMCRQPDEAIRALRADLTEEMETNSTLKAKTIGSQLVAQITLQELVCCVFPQSQFAKFIQSTFLTDPFFLDLESRKLPTVTSLALKRFVANYYDHAAWPLKMRMTICFIETFAVHVRHRPDLLRRNMQTVINFEFLELFHEAGPIFHKLLQQYGGNGPRRDPTVSDYKVLHKEITIERELEQKLAVDIDHACSLFATFKSFLKPMRRRELVKLLREANCLAPNGARYIAEASARRAARRSGGVVAIADRTGQTPGPAYAGAVVMRQEGLASPPAISSDLLQTERSQSDQGDGGKEKRSQGILEYLTSLVSGQDDEDEVIEQQQAAAEANKKQGPQGEFPGQQSEFLDDIDDSLMEDEDAEESFQAMKSSLLVVTDYDAKTTRAIARQKVALELHLQMEESTSGADQKKDSGSTLAMEKTGGPFSRGVYAMNAVPGYNASIAVGELAFLVGRNRSASSPTTTVASPATTAAGSPLVGQRDGTATGRTSTTGSRLSKQQLESLESKEQQPLPPPREVFLKIRRPGIGMKLMCERELLRKLTRDLPGAWVSLDQDMLSKCAQECDFNQECEYLNEGRARYATCSIKGKPLPKKAAHRHKEMRIAVPRVLARPTTLIESKNQGGPRSATASGSIPAGASTAASTNLVKNTSRTSAASPSATSTTSSRNRTSELVKSPTASPSSRSSIKKGGSSPSGRRNTQLSEFLADEEDSDAAKKSGEDAQGRTPEGASSLLRSESLATANSGPLSPAQASAASATAYSRSSGAGSKTENNILVMEVAAGKAYDRLLTEQLACPVNKPCCKWYQALKSYMDAFDVWVEIAILRKNAFFHGDPHLGNLFWDDASETFTFIDFGNSYHVGDAWPGGLVEPMYEFMQGSLLRKPERILKVFPFRSEVSAIERAEVTEKIRKALDFAMDKYYEAGIEKLRKTGKLKPRNPETERPPSALEEEAGAVSNVVRNGVSEGWDEDLFVDADEPSSSDDNNETEQTESQTERKLSKDAQGKAVGGGAGEEESSSRNSSGPTEIKHLDASSEVKCAVTEGNLSEVMFTAAFSEVIAHRQVFDPEQAFEGFLRPIGMHWVCGAKVLTGMLEKQMPEGVRMKEGGPLVPWSEVFPSPFHLLEKSLLSRASKTQGAQDTWELYLSEKDPERREVLWNDYIAPSMQLFAPKTLDTLRMVHKGYKTGVTNLFGNMKSKLFAPFSRNKNPTT